MKLETTYAMLIIAHRHHYFDKMRVDGEFSEDISVD